MTTIAEATREIRRMIGRGRIFGACFIKKDGTTRTGAFRLGVQKDLTGAGQAYDPDERGNIIVWDMHKKAYRTIPLERVQYLTVRGVRVGVQTNREDSK